MALKRIMEGSYELAIRIARALGSEERLAVAYGNFANDLVAFGDHVRGESHAIHALRLATAVGDESQISKTNQLLSKIARERD